MRSKGLIYTVISYTFNVRWLREARRVLKPDGTLWVSGTHHIIFSLGFALQRLEFRVINNIVWSKPNPTPNALHTAFTHLKAVEATSPALSMYARGRTLQK
jgi:DNA modification methylase